MGYAVTVDNGETELDKDYGNDRAKAMKLFTRMIDNPNCFSVTMWKYDDEDGTRIETVLHWERK